MPPPGWVPPPGFAERFGIQVPPARPTLTAAEKEARGQTLLYGLGAAVTLAGLVLLVGMVLDLGTAVLVYSFGLGLAVVTLVLGFRTGSRQVLAPLAVASAVIGGYAVVAAAETLEVTSVVGACMAAVLVALVVFIGWRWEMASVGVWVAWALLFGHYAGTSTYTLVLVGVICLAGTVHRPWPTHQTGVALAAGLMLFANSPARPALVVYVMFALTLAVTLWLVNIVRAVPAPRPAGAATPGELPGNGEVGAQPWHLHLIMFFAAWLGSLSSPHLVEWLSLLLAGAACLVGVAMPEPAGAVRPVRGNLREVLVVTGVCLLAFSLTIGRVDPQIEHYVLLVLAIAVQVRPFVGPGLGWVVRGVPALLAFVATIDTSIGIWSRPEIFTSDPRHLINVGLLTMLGIALMVFRHSQPHPVLDGIRFVLGLYLSGYALVAGAALVGSQVGSMDGGFLAGHAAASVLWMTFAAWIALRRNSRNPAADLTVAGVIAIAAAGKLVGFDMGMLGGIARVAAFLVCGVLMLTIAFLRQKRGAGGPPPGPPAGPMPGQPHWHTPQPPPPPQQQYAEPPSQQPWYGPEGEHRVDR